MPQYVITRRDASEAEIIKAMEKAGVKVWKRLPVDLLTYHRGRWQPIEVKSPTSTGKRRKRKDQPEQEAFCRDYHVPYVTNAIEALQAIGAYHEPNAITGYFSED